MSLVTSPRRLFFRPQKASFHINWCWKWDQSKPNLLINFSHSTDNIDWLLNYSNDKQHLFLCWLCSLRTMKMWCYFFDDSFVGHKSQSQTPKGANKNPNWISYDVFDYMLFIYWWCKQTPYFTIHWHFSDVVGCGIFINADKSCSYLSLQIIYTQRSADEMHAI